MHKAGGLIALISGFFCILASVATYALSYIAPMVDSTLEPIPGMLHMISGFFVASVVIVLASIILNTQSRWPGALLVIFSVIAIANNLGGGFITICLLLTIIGGTLSLVRPRPQLAMA